MGKLAETKATHSELAQITSRAAAQLAAMIAARGKFWRKLRLGNH
jgi:arsenate reductase-like glutaredoxin family protein